MKAAVVTKDSTKPTYTDFEEPKVVENNVLVDVTASALSNVSKMRATGNHYSADNIFPNVIGIDGVGMYQGKRVYFLATNAPYGSLAEQTLINKNLIIPLPDGIDDVTAAAIANPGMSSWTALMSRANFKKGQTVLINGATGVAGSLAVKIAYHLGAKKVIVTGRNSEKLNQLGADVAISFDMTSENGANKFCEDLSEQAKDGIDVVLDYLWGDSALSIMKSLTLFGSGEVTKFISIGSASGQKEIALPSAILRSSKIEIIGSGFKSATLMQIKTAISEVFEWAADQKITLLTNTFTLDDIDSAWEAPLNPRAVVMVK